MKKLLWFLMIITILLSSVNYTFANEVTDDYLKNLAKEMITPTIWDVSNPKFREDTRKKDLEITKKFEALSKKDKDKVMNLVRNNLQENVYQPRYFLECQYNYYPRTIKPKDFSNSNSIVYYWEYTWAVTNDKKWEKTVCDNEISFNTSKPYIWGTTWRARKYLSHYNSILKRTVNWKDKVLLWWNWWSIYYWWWWYDIHNEMFIWW